MCLGSLLVLEGDSLKQLLQQLNINKEKRDEIIRRMKKERVLQYGD